MIKIYGTYTCRYENGTVVLPASFPVQNGTVAFINLRDTDADILNFSFNDIEYWDAVDIRYGGLSISEIYREYPYDILSLTGFGTNFQLHFLPVSSDVDSSCMNEGDCLDILENYLAHAVIIPIEKGKYEFTLQAMNYVNESGCLFSPDLPLLKGLSTEIYKKLFRLQYLPYSEDVKKDKPYFFKSVKDYYPQENQRMLEEMEHLHTCIDKMLVDWANKQPPIIVAVKEERITYFTPQSKSKKMRFWNVNGAIFGSNSPYEEDHSSYVEIDIYKQGRKLL